MLVQLPFDSSQWHSSTVWTPWRVNSPTLIENKGQNIYGLPLGRTKCEIKIVDAGQHLPVRRRSTGRCDHRSDHIIERKICNFRFLIVRAEQSSNKSVAFPEAPSFSGGIVRLHSTEFQWVLVTGRDWQFASDRICWRICSVGQILQPLN